MSISSVTLPSPTDAAQARRKADAAALQRVLVITGMSGAGKTSALKSLEDLGYECVDHVPLFLLARLVRLGADDGEQASPPLAVGIDVRTRDFAVDACLHLLEKLKLDSHLDVRLVFLSCDNEELRRRYTVTRHRHPLAVERPLGDGIALEREMLAPLRTRADLAIDTTRLSPGELKTMLHGHFPLAGQAALTIRVSSFSYRMGLPREADLVLDVRFLANPYYNADLRSLTGRDDAVADFVARDPAFRQFFGSLTGLLAPLLPRYAGEGKSYLTIAVGCTGGRHRSVFVAEQLGAWLGNRGQLVHIHHRDLDGPRPS
jgi:UPF0042 nucleotide-binding protein